MSPPPLPCPIPGCGTESPDEPLLSLHVAFAHFVQERFRCRRCDALFTSKPALVNHLITEHYEAEGKEPEKLPPDSEEENKALARVDKCHECDQVSD